MAEPSPSAPLPEGEGSIREHTAGDGYRWKYREYAKPQAAKGIVVFIHGVQSHGGWYSASCEHLARAGWEVLFLDRRGSGLNMEARGDAPSHRRLIADLDRQFPGIGGAVVQREMATAETMQRYLKTPGGAVYGFAPEDDIMEVAKFTPRTPVSGLWLASAYTFGGGFSFSMLGGAAAARAAMSAVELPWTAAARRSWQARQHAA